MKRFSAIMVLAVFLASCQKEVTLPVDGGFLELSSVGILSSGEVALPTRAVDADLAIEILTSGGVIVKSFPAGSASVSGKIELEAGAYSLKAFSASYGASVGSGEKGSPVYYSEQAFSVAAAKTTYLTVHVPMVNFGVTLSLPEDFSASFSGYEFSVSLAGRSVVLLDGETAYFNLPSGVAALDYSLTAVNVAGESFTQSLSYDGSLTAGTVYKVTYSQATKALSLR